MLRRLARKLLRARHGHSAVEYAILLGLLTLTLGGGVLWLGLASARSLAPLAGQMTGQLPATAPAGNPSGNAVLSAAEASQSKPLPDSGDRFAPASWGAFAFGAGVIGLGCVLLLHRRQRAAQQPFPQDDGELPDLAERFSTKRQYLLRLLSQDPAILFRNQLAVRHLMTTDVITVSPADTRQRIAELMRESHVRHLLVCGPGQQLLGVVSDRDLCSKPGKTAGELMSSRLSTVSSDTLISPATTHLIQTGISSLPVVDDGRLCGILTTTDLILAFQSLLQLWLHAASMMQGEIWEQEFMQKVQSQLDAADADTCFGVKGVFESLMDRGQAVS